uniref:Transmembrane protein 263 n=1 Tax=Phallusia mammillata TaxID=59560 RepID=A0A6F9DUJ2_9ASCI|nr:transmembrane protein 263 [Phallusia mammillata]
MKDMTESNKPVQSLSYEDFQNEENCQPVEQAPSGGILWRMGSGMVNMTKGAVTGTVGLGVGAVKLVANTSYGVVSKTAEVGVNATKTVANKSYGVVSGGVSAVSGGVSAVTSRLPGVPLPTLKRGKDKEE